MLTAYSYGVDYECDSTVPAMGGRLEFCPSRGVTLQQELGGNGGAIRPTYPGDRVGGVREEIGEGVCGDGRVAAEVRIVLAGATSAGTDGSITAGTAESEEVRVVD